MGYSNNKWRKILYILMIINLCFILFAKFTKVFGSFDFDYNDNTISLPDLPIDEYNEDCKDTYIISYSSGYYWVYFFKFENIDNVYLNTSNNQIYSNPSQIIKSPYYRLTNNTTWNRIAVRNNTTISTSSGISVSSVSEIRYSTFDIKDINGNILFASSSEKFPEIANTQQQLETLDFDVLSVNAWDYSNEDFDVLFYDLNYGSDTTDSLYPVNVITLNKETLYYNSTLTADPDKNAIYWIPIEEIGFNWVKGNKYGIKFAVRDYGIQGGGGFRGDDYIYQYIGEETVFTISNTVPDSVITALNNSTQNNIQNNQHEEIINNMNNITNNLDNVNDALTNTTPDNSVSSDIDSALDFNNQNEGLNNLNNGFFSRLTSMLSNLLGYNLGEDSTVSIPLPHSNKSIVLHSKTIYDNVTGNLRLIINAFWVYIFSFYMWRFINKIYIAISTGNILDTFSSSGEAITNDML